MACPVAFAAMSDSTTSAGSAEHGFQFVRRGRVEKIELHKIDAGDRLHRLDVDGDDAAVLRSADALGRHLAPATGGGAKIDHAGAFLEDARFVVDFDELEGGA